MTTRNVDKSRRSRTNNEFRANNEWQVGLSVMLERLKAIVDAAEEDEEEEECVPVGVKSSSNTEQKSK